MRRIIYWATIASGVVAAVIMYRRGESVPTIARKTVTNPIGSLVNEFKPAG